jgi:hypothetical protein
MPVAVSKTLHSAASLSSGIGNFVPLRDVVVSETNLIYVLPVKPLRFTLSLIFPSWRCLQSEFEGLIYNNEQMRYITGEISQHGNGPPANVFNLDLFSDEFLHFVVF